MKKIENIIESCRECRHCQTFTSEDGKRVARICGYEELCNPDEQQRILGCVSSVSVGNPIPSWCPLETYKEAEKPESQPVSAPSPIILPGLPGLEWMTENLSGFGGTEINGNTYYTWEEAMAAAEQLGDGWRLPTREEFVQLCDLGSTWDEDRKGRWFGGNHDTDHEGSLFIPASGYRGGTTGALAHVGTLGYSLSSSPLAADQVKMGYLGFDADYVYPLESWYRSAGFPVRCVRNVK